MNLLYITYDMQVALDLSIHQCCFCGMKLSSFSHEEVKNIGMQK